MSTNIHIYSEKKSNRLLYTLKEIFERRMRLTPVLHRNVDSYKSATGLKLNYSNEELEGVHIKPAALLFERRIDDHDLSAFKDDGVLKLFKTNNGIGYDPLASAFYFLTRYEEYLPHREDEHGRYRADQSVVVKNECAHLPLVEMYCEELAQKLGLEQQQNHSDDVLVTVDVDQVFAYRAKGLARTIVGAVKSIVKPSESFSDRLAVLLGQEEDPLDLYDELTDTLKQYGIQSIFFFQVGEASAHDINNPPHLSLVRQRINDIAMRTEIGLHPSYHSSGSPEMLGREMERLRKITSAPIMRSRQHYLKFRVPETFKLLKEVGVQEEYSMGFTSSNGFRASTCKPYSFYDLRGDDRLDLEMMPSAWMDMVAVRNHVRVEDAQTEMQDLKETVRRYGGQFITTWHPDSLVGMNSHYPSLPLLEVLIGKDAV